MTGVATTSSPLSLWVEGELEAGYPCMYRGTSLIRKRPSPLGLWVEGELEARDCPEVVERRDSRLVARLYSSQVKNNYFVEM